MFSSDRDDYRTVFFSTWKKHQANEPLEPIEAQLLQLILAHPEYHDILEEPELFKDKNFDSDNPFLHLSLHLGIREQIATNRPAGIREAYQGLCEKYKDLHTAEHQMMEHLGKTLWEAQRNGSMPDEAAYLEGLRRLL